MGDNDGTDQQGTNLTGDQDAPQGDPHGPQEFVRLFLANQRRIFSYVVVLVPNFATAEDIVQESAAMMWEKFDQFTPGTNFAAWAIRIAKFKVLEHRRRGQRKRLLFSDDLVVQIADDAADMADEAAARDRALAHCIEELGERERQLVSLRYTQGSTLEKMGLQIDRSVVTVRKRLRSILAALEKCISRRIAEEEIA
ncbi:MAG: sigma-70 family RNA polymerase sigma factor [Planctomycetes bacterium]|nr:sigma-70 family RNA polymerase sigma factor [Planctomycetota bacterium]